VDELHGHRPFADGSGASLGGAGADVPGGKDACDARVEDAGSAGLRAREDETVVVALDLIV
jgi:hypothetical protein